MKANKEALRREALARWEGEGGKTAPAKTPAQKKGKQVTEKETLQGAADEARKAARAAREFAALLDDYAKHVTQPGWRQKADDLHYAAMSKLRVVTDGLAACNKFIAASGNGAPAQAPEQAVEKKAAAKREAAAEAPKTPRVRFVKKGGRI
jgi:hypothetical protein